MSTLDEIKKAEEARLRRDLRTRTRPNLVLDKNDNQPIVLPDLIDQTVPVTAQQPALGIATYIPGCNCQECRRDMYNDHED